MAIKQYGKTANVTLSANLKSNEFACKGTGCCNTVLIDETLVNYVQKIREHFNAPVTINSGYRCKTHNKAVGGVSNSNHTKGTAADIVVKDVAPSEVAKYAESIGVLGIGLYETAKDGYFTHIDTRTKKSFWYGQKQAKRDTFGGVKVEEKIGWIKDTTGWWYRHADGTYTKNGWEQIGSEWFYFDENGYAIGENRWKQINGKWYYFNERNAAVKGYRTIDGKLYYFAESGTDTVSECQLIVTDNNGAIV